MLYKNITKAITTPPKEKITEHRVVPFYQRKAPAGLYPDINFSFLSIWIFFLLLFIEVY